MNKKNCIVAQSGGPTAAINASLAGVINAVLSSGNYDTIYGSKNGITGLLEGEYLNLTHLVKKQPKMLHTLKHSPAMYLGSCRFKLPDFADDPAIYRDIFREFESMEISAFFYIGGNDSMDTVLKLSSYAEIIQSPVKILGIPKTIDNDLCATDHTPGFGSAAKYIASTVLEIAHDTYIYDMKSVTIIEIMGRDAGWLTASSALARNTYNTAPHLIYLPEVPFSKEQFLQDIAQELETKNNIIVAVSEGIRDQNGDYISASEGKTDNFGHARLSGAGKTLEYLLNDHMNIKVRSVELNVLQRCASHLASATDLAESYALGETAVSLAIAGTTASMSTIRRTSDTPYTVVYESAPIQGIANEAKSVPRSFINEMGNDVTGEMITYLKPLIIGEPALTFVDGLPQYLDVSHLI